MSSMPSAMLFALAQTAEQPKASTVVQTVLVVVLVTFVLSIILTKFVAKAANVHDATFGKAFLATIFKNMAGWGSLVFLGLAPGMSPVFTVAVAFAMVPILVYKIVFGTEWIQAFVIWIAVFAAELGVGYAILGESLTQVVS